MRSAARWILLFLVRFYITFLSAYFGGACKFYPSCSQYAQEAIARHGAARGSWLALKRLGRCRPFTQGGYDPVSDEPFAQRGEYFQESEAATAGIHPRGEEPAK
ncbi:MAG: membrane protein insertion efficiency factor YidD [Candidatus Acidiferrales bacterium]